MLVSSHRNRSGPPASFFPMHLQKKLHRPHIGDAAEVCLNKKNLLRRYEGTNEGANLLPSTYLRWYIKYESTNKFIYYEGMYECRYKFITTKVHSYVSSYVEGIFFISRNTNLISYYLYLLLWIPCFVRRYLYLENSDS